MRIVKTALLIVATSLAVSACGSKPATADNAADAAAASVPAADANAVAPIADSAANAASAPQASGDGRDGSANPIKGQ
jgi:hypothetical protein